MVILGGDVAQQLPTDGIDLAIEVEKADGTLWLLKGLNRGMKQDAIEATVGETDVILDRKSTRLNSSHGYISYAVFCLKKTTSHFAVTSLRSARTVSRAMILPPIAAWIATSYCCCGTNSFSFSASTRPRLYARSVLTMI